MKKQYLAVPLLMSSLTLIPLQASADMYELDTTHSFIQFRIQHLGYSWLYGRFSKFSGSFEYDEASPQDLSVDISIETDSVDSNHAERDRHLRSDDFLDVKAYEEAIFVSTRFTPSSGGEGVLTGNLTLRNITKSIDIAVTPVGGGDDPWGGYRQGFYGTTSIKLADFGIPKDLGPASQEVEFSLSLEGVRL